MAGRAKKEVKQKALAMLRDGVSLEQISEVTGVSVSTLAKWKAALHGSDLPSTTGVTMDPAGSAALQSSPVGIIGAGAVGPQIHQADKGPDLAALAGQHPGAANLEFHMGAPAAPPIEPPKPVTPPLDAKALVATVKIAKAGFVQVIAMGWGITLDEEQVDKLSKFTPIEEQQLELFAPYAAKYTPLVTTYAEPAMAFMFVAVAGMSAARSFSELKKMRVPKPQKPPMDHKPKTVGKK